MQAVLRWGTTVVVGAMLGLVPTLGQEALQVYFVDVEGGQATLIVAPSGQSLLIDSGFPGERDAGRIAAAATDAGLEQIDYHMVTHLHGDHMGSTPVLVTKIPILNYVDVGMPIDPSGNAYQAYASARESGHHIVARPGDRIPVDGLDVQIVTADGTALAEPLPGAGQPNPLCRDFTPLPVDESEDARSVGVVIRHGNFSMVDLGDLTWNKEHDLACPDNMLGTVDLYLATRHGLNGAGLPALVHGLQPRVSVINNGGTKGASPEHFLTIKRSPGLEDIWQLHYSMPRDASRGVHETSPPGGPDLNTSELLIANLDDHPQVGDLGVLDDTTAHYLKLTARADGSFMLLNPRNGHTKEYDRRP
jgi:competence protein ComEC